MARRVARVGERRPARVRPQRRCRVGAGPAAVARRQLPREPAEHLHRQAHRTHARRRPRPLPRPLCLTLPELPEVEAYRQLAERVVGRTIVAVDIPDPWFVKQGDPRALVGCAITAVRRRGKLLLVDTDGPTLGLRFGMTGRLVVDGTPGVDALLYSSNADRPAYDRFALHLSEGVLAVRDPRRLGGVSVDPDEARLGPDALGIGAAALRAALAASEAPLKARLMDQARMAGVGNLVADELLWRARLDPARPAGNLTAAESRLLARA